MEADPEITCGIVGNIGQFWLKEQFIDLQINIDDHQFRCHRFILCACSEFFQVLLQSEMKDEVKEVTVRGISPAMFQLALNAIYKGENGLATENMMEFWHAAHELQIPVLVAKCETFISCHMTRENILAIYTRALLLGSDKIIKIVHEFMAENFEYFRKCQIFMLLSAKTLQEILSSKHLKVNTQNDLVDLILKWVSHEPCGKEVEKYAGDILEVQNANIVSDQRVDHSSSGINDKTLHVEVKLQKPPVTSEDFCLQTVAQLLTETPAARKQSLGELLKLVRLSEASRDCLEMLADSDLIMGVKETRDIVRQALEARSHAQETVNTTALTANCIVDADVLVKTEQVVIFVKGDTVYAYALDRSGIFYFMSCSDLLRVYTCNNCIFITETVNSEAQMTVNKFLNSGQHKIVFKNVQSCSAVVGDFLYIFNDSSLFRKRCDDQSNDWFELINFKRKVNCVLVNIFKGNIIFYDLETREQTMFGFNTKTHKVSGIKTFSEVRKVVSFIHNDQLYVLTPDGYLWNITADVDSPTAKSCDAELKSEHIQPTLWNYSYYSNRYESKGRCLKQAKTRLYTRKLVGVSDQQTVSASDPQTVSASVPQTVSASVPQTFSAFFPQTVSAFVPQTVSASVPQTVSAPVPQTLSAFVPQTVSASVPQTVRAFVPQTVSTFVPQTVSAPVPQTVSAPVPQTVNAPVPQTVSAPVPQTVSAPVPQKLWEGSYELLGAVIHTGKLVIFADLNYCKASVITNQNIMLGVSEIEFIHLHSANKCYPLVVPSTMLVKEV
ncbi:hypothetical protein BsWGS_23966 [Bradybaena similaris]